MNRIIVEVGSTCIKVDKYDGEKIEKLDGKTIHLDFVSNLYVLYSFIFTFSVTLQILFKSLIIY